MKKIDDTYVLDREELIRINRLVRDRIDIDGFRDWYNSISRDEQNALMFAIYTMAMQTGFHIPLWEKAAELSGTSTELSERLKTLIRDGTIGKLRAWFITASDDERQSALPLLVQLFGESEAAVMALETSDTCNHWWHRDLCDPQVIDDLMSNPNWTATSPKDDRK